MAGLSEADLRVMIGPDYERVLRTSADVTVTSTPEEHAASRALRAKKLSDMNFTFYAVMFTGICLVGGGVYNGAGLFSVQGLAGMAMVVLGVGGLAYNYSRSRTLAGEAAAAGKL